ncbi:hypothetical protein EZS27_012679 [termite gut metagenome]|uniref:Uncharacterized protein n=1 Tax=termite gut metagenome TaxID=433724 RepID=A0A5J4S1L3_9ZZZZ
MLNDYSESRNKEISVANIVKILLRTLLFATVFAWREIKYGFVVRIEFNRSIKCTSCLRTHKTFYQSGLAVHQKVGKLSVRQLFFSNGTPYGKSAGFILTLGNFLIT